ncbi:MarR family winged helix-turn-helix transcriptional regulator [Bacillus niameyensis]|uniref:MarR family winged helix-turn-helix transcriptional regulator n=1 Tax=Bacillus niameyensis TaxID=1522308 RepID=UPI0007816C76|nr:MarR family transcriptional regulator [Bacillus niameyensis]
MDVDEFKNILWEYTRKIGENTNIAMNSLCDQFDLTILQMRILMAIKQEGFHTIGSLAHTIHVAGTNMSTMCKRLEKKELIQRIRDQNDERVVKVILTDKGLHIVDEIDRMLIEKISQYVDNVSTETLYEIIAGLKKMNELLEGLHTKY